MLFHTTSTGVQTMALSQTLLNIKIQQNPIKYKVSGYFYVLTKYYRKNRRKEYLDTSKLNQR